MERKYKVTFKGETENILAIVVVTSMTVLCATTRASNIITEDPNGWKVLVNARYLKVDEVKEPT